MFSRKSANVLSKDSGATSPSDAPPSTAAVGSVLNSGLSFALMEERACVSLLHKLSGTHLEGVYGVWSVVHCGPFSVRGGRGGTRRGIGKYVSHESPQPRGLVLRYCCVLVV